MSDAPPSKQRLVVVMVIAAAVLFAIVIATGRQTLSSPNGASDVTTQPVSNATAAPTTAATSGAVKGAVTASVQHLSGHTWRFRYTVRATGKTPVGGFQISGPTAHLFHIVGPGWTFYGTGVCKSTGPPGLLIYWSTNAVTGTVIRPGKSAVFGFDASTSGAANTGYSLSYGTAAPQFGQVKAPITSTLAAPRNCR